MTTLVIGGPGSGKSALAEELAVKTGDEKRYYLATMAVCDAAGEERVKKHRSQREGKGFVTIERQTDLPGVLPELEDAEEAAVLIECVANLVGNEMQRADKVLPGSFADELMSGIRFLADHVRDLIIVTDEFEKESGEYDASTRMYIRLLDLVNEKLMEFADVVYDLRSDSGQRTKLRFGRSSQVIKGFRRLIVTFSLYSVIPMPRISFDDDDMACSLMWFPLVGAVIGAGVFVVNGTALKEALPAAVRVMLTLLIPIVVTGGIHLDGFMDTEDALHSYAPKEKKLEILKDPHIGAFAVIGLVRTGLILAAAVTMILISEKSGTAAVLLLASVFVTGRALSGLTSLHFKKARDEGMLCKETKGSSSLVYICLFLQLLLSVVLTLSLDVKRGALVLAAFALYTVYYRYGTSRSFGGVTGDTAGHYLVQSETAAAAVLALAMLLFR